MLPAGVWSRIARWPIPSCLFGQAVVGRRGSKEASLGVVVRNHIFGLRVSWVKLFFWEDWDWERVVHVWPVPGTYWRGSSQIRQVGGVWDKGTSYWAPQVTQMARSSLSNFMFVGLILGCWN